MATAKKATPAKSGAKKQEGLMGYCMKTKQMEPITDAVIEEKGGRYICKGVTSEDSTVPGCKVAVIMSADQAQAAIDNGWADLAEEPAKAAPAKKATPAKK